MKVLHVWSAAGVASTIAKFTDRLYGTESLVLKRLELDTFGADSSAKDVRGGPVAFYLEAVLRARHFDIVNVHSVQRVIPWLKRLYPKKPVVFTRHGVGRRSGDNRGYLEADAVVTVNPYLDDLMEDVNPVHISAPVDTDFFHGHPHDSHEAMTFTYGADDIAAAYAKRNVLCLHLFQRNIPYASMPSLLGSFSYYVDVKRDFTGQLLEARSKTGLEALACGLKVVGWDGEVVQGLPRENRPEEVAQRYYELYTRLVTH